MPEAPIDLVNQLRLLDQGAVCSREQVHSILELFGVALGCDRVFFSETSEGEAPRMFEWQHASLIVQNFELDDSWINDLLLQVARKVETSEERAEVLLIKGNQETTELSDILANFRIEQLLSLVLKGEAHGASRRRVIVFLRSSRDWTEHDQAFLEEVSELVLAERLFGSGASKKKKQFVTSTDEELSKKAELVQSAVPQEEFSERGELDLSTLGPSGAFDPGIINHSSQLLFQTDRAFAITAINRTVRKVVGVKPEDFLTTQSINLIDLVYSDDTERIKSLVGQMAESLKPFTTSFRVLNHLSGELFLLTAELSPRRKRGRVIGWFASCDVSPYEAAKEVETEQFELLDDGTVPLDIFSDLAASISGFYDSESVALRGVETLRQYTAADGVAWLSLEQGGAVPLSLLAQTGLPAAVQAIFTSGNELPELFSDVIRSGQVEFIADTRSEPRIARNVSESAKIRSLCVVPISVEARCSALVVLFSRETNAFSFRDSELVLSAGVPVALAAREAALVAIYRKQTKNLAALYRLSRELSATSSLDDIFNRAFTIIREELGFRRLWIGLLNETNTRIVGQAAHGPGWKRRLIQINVELAGGDHPIARVVNQRRSMIINEPDRILKEFGSRKFFSRFSVSSVGLVPLISAGQMLGVLAFQPDDGAKAVGGDELALVSSLASEIANAIFARQLDKRVGEAEKMQAAGLLAAGIAHNFNNVLQAIIGQASLIEIQDLSKEQLNKAAGSITKSATKGATLVQQLTSFASLEEPHFEVFDLNSLIERHRSSLARSLAKEENLILHLNKELPRANADSGQILRILQGLVRNASEASEEKQLVEIFTDSISVDEESPQYEIPYGEYVRLGVRDYGRGMDEETKQRCFEPFFTTKDLDPGSGLSLSGAGLGLSSSFTLARKNGGRLVVESRLGQGSVFTLYIPVAEQSEKKPRNKESLEVEVERLHGRAEHRQPGLQANESSRKAPRAKKPKATN